MVNWFLWSLLTTIVSVQTGTFRIPGKLSVETRTYVGDVLIVAVSKSEMVGSVCVCQVLSAAYLNSRLLFKSHEIQKASEDCADFQSRCYSSVACATFIHCILYFGKKTFL